jgi:lysozyme
MKIKRSLLASSASILVIEHLKRMTNILQKAAQFVKQWEGCRLEAYQDSGGLWTIGYGATTDVHNGMTITQEEAINFLENDLEYAYHAILRLTRVFLKENQMIALLDFVYNVGSGAYQRSSLRAHINRQDYEGAAKQFMKWNKVRGQVIPGLTKRRKAEKDLFLIADKAS